MPKNLSEFLCPFNIQDMYWRKYNPMNKSNEGQIKRSFYSPFCPVIVFGIYADHNYNKELINKYL